MPSVHPYPAGMGDSILSVVPTDCRWRPGPDAGRAAGDLVATLASGDRCDVAWHDEIRLVDCGANLERIGCPRCGRELPDDWFGDALDGRSTPGGGFASLDVVAPCCGTATTLDALDYHWPMAFARFTIAVRNPSLVSGLLPPAAAAEVAATLGHEVRQVRAHY